MHSIQTTQSLDKHSNRMMLFYYHIVPPLGALQDASFTAGYVWMCFSRPHHPPPASNNNNFRSPYSVQLSTLSSILWWFMEIEFQSLSPWHNINSLGWFTEIRMCSIVSSYIPRQWWKPFSRFRPLLSIFWFHYRPSYSHTHFSSWMWRSHPIIIRQKLIECFVLVLGLLQCIVYL